MKIVALHVSDAWSNLLGAPGKAPTEQAAIAAGERAAALLPAYVATVSAGFERVLLVLDGDQGWRREFDPQHSEARDRWPRAAWAPLQGAVGNTLLGYVETRGGCTALVPPLYPAGVMLDVGADPTGDGRDVLDLGGKRPAARDALATLAAWWRFSDRSPHKRRQDAAFRIVSSRKSVACLADDAAGIELVRSVTPPGKLLEWTYAVAHPAEIAAEVGSGVAQWKALETLGGWEKARTKAARSCLGEEAAKKLIAAHGEALVACLLAAATPAGETLPGVNRAAMAVLRAGAAHDGAMVRRALAIHALRDDVAIDVGALLRLDGGDDGDDDGASDGRELHSRHDGGPGAGGSAPHHGRLEGGPEGGAPLRPSGRGEPAPVGRGRDPSDDAGPDAQGQGDGRVDPEREAVGNPGSVGVVAAPPRPGPPPAAPSLPRAAGWSLIGIAADLRNASPSLPHVTGCPRHWTRHPDCYACTTITDRDTKPANATGAIMPPTDTSQTAEPTYDQHTGEEQRVAAPLAIRPEPIVALTRPIAQPAEKGPPPMMSDDTGILWQALWTAQEGFDEVRKTRPMTVRGEIRYHYANLSDVVNAVMPSLKKNGFVCSHICRGNRLHVRLVHVPSGQWIEGVLPFVAPTVNGPEGVQALGSLLTYLRRYLLSMLLGVVAVDDDDDGVSAKDAPQPARRAS